MKQVKRLVFLVTIMVVSAFFMGSNAYSACNTTTCIGKIKRVYISGATLFISTDGDERALNCTSPANVYVTIPTSDSMFDAKYATLLTAMSLGKSVGLRIIENDPNCAVSYVYMDN